MNLLVRQGRSWSGRERNCCFLNTRHGAFASIAAVSGLDASDDSRAVAVTDWDSDGRSDLWISSRTGPRMRFFHNRYSSANHFIAFGLRGVSCNRDAIGARLVLHLGAHGTTRRIKTLRAGEGFLSQSSKWMLFGIGQETTIARLVVHWPGGEAEEFGDLTANSRYIVEQGSGRALLSTRDTADVRLESSEIELPLSIQNARIVTLSRPLLPHVEYLSPTNSTISLLDSEREPTKGVLVNLWSSSCEPCLRELQEFSAHEQRIRKAGLDIVALCVDHLGEGGAAALSTTERVLAELEFPFRWGIATDAIVRSLDTLHQSLVDLQYDLPVPCSFLITPQGELIVLYKGRLGLRQLLDDVDLLSADATRLRSAAVPFEGRWITKPIPPYPQDVALKLVEQGRADDAVRYLRTYLQSIGAAPNEVAADEADIHFLLGRLLTDRGDRAEGLVAYQDAIRTNPDYRKARIKLADLLLKQHRPAEAIAQLEAALKLEPNDPVALVAQGVAYASLRKLDAAAGCYQQALKLQPDHRQARANLARLVHARGNTSEAVVLYRELLRRDPESVSDANNLAWILATSSDPAIHNPAEAVRWAETSCGMTNHQDPRYLTTLAAAYSEAGRFKDAILTANAAIRTAYATGRPKIAATVEKHLRYYEAGKSYQQGRRP